MNLVDISIDTILIILYCLTHAEPIVKQYKQQHSGDRNVVRECQDVKELFHVIKNFKDQTTIRLLLQQRMLTKQVRIS